MVFSIANTNLYSEYIFTAISLYVSFSLYIFLVNLTLILLQLCPKE